MKHTVFGNGLCIMADLFTGLLRVRRLETLSLLISRKDFLGAAFRTHPTSRGSRSIDGFLCALRVISPILESNTYITRHETNNRTNQRTNDTRDAMILTKLSKAQRRNTQGGSGLTSNTHMIIGSRHFVTESLHCIAVFQA